MDDEEFILVDESCGGVGVVADVLFARDRRGTPLVVGHQGECGVVVVAGHSVGDEDKLVVIDEDEAVGALELSGDVNGLECLWVVEWDLEEEPFVLFGHEEVAVGVEDDAVEIEACADESVGGFEEDRWFSRGVDLVDNRGKAVGDVGVSLVIKGEVIGEMELVVWARGCEVDEVDRVACCQGVDPKVDGVLGGLGCAALADPDIGSDDIDTVS